MKNDKFHIGSNTLSGDAVRLGTDEILKHWLINGGTGRGKSKLLEGLLRWHIRNGHGVMLLDPHGHLYNDVLAYMSASGHESKLVLIDANELTRSPGLNFLEVE